MKTVCLFVCLCVGRINFQSGLHSNADYWFLRATKSWSQHSNRVTSISRRMGAVFGVNNLDDSTDFPDCGKYLCSLFGSQIRQSSFTWSCSRVSALRCILIGGIGGELFGTLSSTKTGFTPLRIQTWLILCMIESLNQRIWPFHAWETSKTSHKRKNIHAF